MDYTGQERRERRYLTNLTSNQLLSHGAHTTREADGNLTPRRTNWSVPSPLHGLPNRQERRYVRVRIFDCGTVWDTEECLARKLIS